VLTAIAIIPSAPVLVPELAGAAAQELADLRRAVFAAAATLPDRWLAVGVGPTDARIPPDAAGTFGGYGVDLRVGLSPLPGTPGVRPLAGEPAVLPLAGEPAVLPLCALMTGWVRGQVSPQARAEVRVFAADHYPDTARRSGRRLRAEVEAATGPTGVLVVADGANSLTKAAPGGYDPTAADAQRALADALAGGDRAALLGLAGSITGRVAYQVLAGLAEPAPRSAKELYRGAPYGVGYFAGVWQP
jgi:hypothetical protein